MKHSRLLILLGVAKRRKEVLKLQIPSVLSQNTFRFANVSLLLSQQDSEENADILKCSSVSREQSRNSFAASSGAGNTNSLVISTDLTNHAMVTAV